MVVKVEVRKDERVYTVMRSGTKAKLLPVAVLRVSSADKQQADLEVSQFLDAQKA